MNHLILISFVVLALYIWLDTDAPIEYATLFRLKFMGYQEYWQKKKTFMANVNYMNFLLMTKNNFFTRLITCPYCLGTWLTLVFFGVFHKELAFKFFASDLMLSWILYSGLRKILSKLNE